MSSEVMVKMHECVSVYTDVCVSWKLTTAYPVVELHQSVTPSYGHYVTMWDFPGIYSVLEKL